MQKIMKPLRFISIFLFILNIGFTGSSQGLGGTETCDGGSCSYKQFVMGEIVDSCEACCLAGQSPSCSTFGCECNFD